MPALNDWFSRLDFVGPYRGGRIIIRHRIEKQIRGWTIQVASSCGTRAESSSEAGFVSVRLWQGKAEGDPIFTRTWQADSWREAETDLNRLFTLLQTAKVAPLVCSECGGEEDDRVLAHMKCGPCAYGGK